jgi:hypothetical protein
MEVTRKRKRDSLLPMKKTGEGRGDGSEAVEQGRESRQAVQCRAEGGQCRGQAGRQAGRQAVKARQGTHERFAEWTRERYGWV